MKTKNKAAQELQKLSKAAQEKKLGKKGYQKDMSRRIKVRWNAKKETKKLSPIQDLDILA